MNSFEKFGALFIVWSIVLHVLMWFSGAQISDDAVFRSAVLLAATWVSVSALIRISTTEHTQEEDGK